jgi:hypothetical protein
MWNNDPPPPPPPPPKMPGTIDKRELGGRAGVNIEKRELSIAISSLNM